MRKLSKVIPLLLILLAPPAMMYPLWSNPVSAGEDDVIFYYPLRVMVGQAMARGDLPMSNPLEATGGPLLADPQAAAMHPTTWLFALGNADLAYTISIFTAYWLAGLGMLLYLRRLGLGRAASTFGAIAFMFSGFMIGHRVHLSMIMGVAMLPWGLWCVELLRGGGKTTAEAIGSHESAQPRAAVLHAQPRLLLGFGTLVPVVFLALAAGNWPTVIQMSVIWFAYLCLRGRPFWRTLTIVAFAMVLAAAPMGPQLMATVEAMSQATRQRIGFSTAGENSFFLPSGVLAVFPMLLGNRIPNFFAQPWWGPWHQCETLGYVGMITLVLALAAVWRLYRKPRNNSQPGAAVLQATLQSSIFRDLRMTSIVRTWTWIAIGGCVWMMGYYIPPLFKVIHAIPVLGVVRCPSRMLMAVDLALAALAACGVHMAVSAARQAEDRRTQRSMDKSDQRQRQLLLGINADEDDSFWPAKLAKTYRKISTIVMPLGMAAVLGAVALCAWHVESYDFWQFFRNQGGGQEDARAAMRFANPAVWVQLALAAGTIPVIWVWSARPDRRAALLTIMLLVDLFFVVRFVDMPPADKVMQNPAISPAATWLKENTPPDQAFRVYGLSREYYDRAAELLLPKTCESLGVSTIASYGPFQRPAHAQLLGFNTAGINRDWAGLVRRNYLLSNYNVRYVLAADSQFRDVLESVHMQRHARPDGPELLGAKWDIIRVSQADGELTFVSKWMWQPCTAAQLVSLKPNRVYRISLEARGPDGGAGDYLRAEVCNVFTDQPDMKWDQTGMSVRAEEIGTQWRRFVWQFQTPATLSDGLVFQLVSISERPIEVRNVSLRESSWDSPFDTTGRLKDGDAVYIPAVGKDGKTAVIPAMDPTAPPVVIYENRLCRTGPEPASRPAITDEQIDELRWASGYHPGRPAAEGPDLAFHFSTKPETALQLTTVSAAGLYALVLVIGWFVCRRCVSLAANYTNDAKWS